MAPKRAHAPSSAETLGDLYLLTQSQDPAEVGQPPRDDEAGNSDNEGDEPITILEEVAGYRRKHKKLQERTDKEKTSQPAHLKDKAKVQNIEVPNRWQCPYNKLWPAKSRAANESILYLHYLEEFNGACVAAQEQLARTQCRLVELKKMRPSPKAIRCESTDSAPQSVVAEKQFSHKVKQRKIPAQVKLTCGNNKEVTSKFRPLQDVQVDQRKVAGRAQQDLSHHMNVEGGKLVILHSYVRPYLPVAKATLQTCSPSKIVGGKALGIEFCQVFVNEVLDRKAPLIRPFGAMTTMADALGYSIAWIREKGRDEVPTFATELNSGHFAYDGRHQF